MNCMAMGIPKAEISWELPDKSHLTATSRLYGNRFLYPQGSLTVQQATQRETLDLPNALRKTSWAATWQDHLRPHLLNRHAGRRGLHLPRLKAKVFVLKS